MVGRAPLNPMQHAISFDARGRLDAAGAAESAWAWGDGGFLRLPRRRPFRCAVRVCTNVFCYVIKRI